LRTKKRYSFKANESPELNNLPVVMNSNAVSLTFTINLAFGSALWLPDTGIHQQRDDDFASAPGVP